MEASLRHAPRLAFIAAVLLAMSCGAQGPDGPPPFDPGPPPLPGYSLVWHDEFDGTVLDRAKWTAQLGVRRDANNTAAAVDVQDGRLTITTYSEGGAHYTGFLDSAGKYQPTYGFIEARIRFDPSPGEWGAFWLQSPTMGNPIGDPASAGTEIDVVEHRARNAAGGDLTNLYVINLHWDGYGASHKTVGSTVRPPAGTTPLVGNWHSYAVLWTPERYHFFLDGVEQWSTTSAVSRRSEFIRLTCEVEDRGWAGNIPAGGYGPPAASTTRMQVDWVRVWQRF